MDIQIESTPPKRNPQAHNPCTPPRKSTPFCETPDKKQSSKNITEKETPNKNCTTPIKQENPESKKVLLNCGTHRKTPKTPGSSNRKIAEFNLSRLEQDYVFQRKLGEGNFSTVGLYRSRMTGDLFAIKTTKLSSMSVNEAQALGTLSIFSQKSKNIIRYFHSWVQNLQLFLVMQYCNQNLSQILKKSRSQCKKLSQTQIKNILKQALQGLKSMHENQIVHLDIKPDNILFKDSVLKISDLGLARITKIKRQGDLEEGDSRYLAKQMLNFMPGMDLTKADIFSLAMTIYEGVSLEILPNNGEEWLQMREFGLNIKNRMDLQEYSSELLQILQIMTHPNPRNRPSASQILKMQYFKESLTRKSRLLMQNNQTKAQKNGQRKKEGSV